MKIVITGSKGFVGSHLVNSLSNHQIIEWDIKINKDIKNFDLESNVDFVIHLAALTDVRESIKKPQDYWKTNVEYSKKIFDMCKNIPIVYASTSCVREWWLSPYGTTKKVMEEFAHEGHIGLRFTNIYGENAPDFMLTSRIKNGNVEYKTNHIRDFIHISDVLDVIKLFLKIGTLDKNRTYDVGSGKGVRIDELVERNGFDVPYKEGDKCEMMNNTANISDILDVGWSGPKVFI